MSAIDIAFPSVDSTVVTTLGRADSAYIKLIQDGINLAETNNFISGFNASEGISNNAIGSSILLSRNVNLDDVAKHMTANNNKLMNGAKDTYLRQGEINEWQAQNKLDTLFFLQSTFLFFTLMVFLIFLRQFGVVTTRMLWIIGSTFTLILIGILWNRASYTGNSRDKRHWNRRFIGLEDANLLAIDATCPEV
jgi:hypothetical protein